MIFLKQLQNIKTPSSTTLLDIAIILSILPHLFVMKFFMYVYLVVALVFIFKVKVTKGATFLLMSIGFLLIVISFFNNYNFSNFSRMQFFVSLVSSFLIYAITLQKFTKEINIYLKISPILLMLLSFFFFESITMLVYTLMVLFAFVLLNIWSRMDESLLEVVKLTSRLFVLSLPVVVILFLVFPRISFKKAEFGFRADSYLVSGYDGKMSVSSKEIKLSNRVVMEVLFEDEDISDKELYFRGSILYNQKDLEWSNSFLNNPIDKLVKISRLKNYGITIYPHANKWIYALDIPFKTPLDIKLNKNYVLEAKKPIYEKKRYKLESALSYILVSKNLVNALKVDTKLNDKTYKVLQKIKKSHVSDEQKANLLLNFFKNQNLAYTLKPTKIDLEDFTDSFLFDAKNGYCVHFSSAFAQSARMLDIPSRVVTGFKADKKNMLNNYLIVKAKDAHAWVELYLDKKGWVRFDPTATATKNLDTVEHQQEQVKRQSTIFENINLNFMYVKYLVNNWILDYNRLKQLSILNNLLNNTLYLIKFILSIVAVFIFSFLVYISIKSVTCDDKFTCEMQKLLRLLKKYDIHKKENEAMQVFLKRTQSNLGISLEKISEIYHKEKYAKKQKNNNLQELKVQIKEFKRKLKDVKNA